jgi:hypothetical protein
MPCAAQRDNIFSSTPAASAVSWPKTFASQNGNLTAVGERFQTVDIQSRRTLKNAGAIVVSMK